MAADPVNTATGALMEIFGDVSLAGLGQSINLTRTYNSMDTSSGPFGPGWSYAYGATLIQNEAGEFVFSDGSGTQTRFGALLGGGYAPIDAAVSADLSDGPNGTRVMRNLSGDTMTFDATGALIATADERGQGLTMGYTADQLTTITDELGQSLTFVWDAGAGDDARISSATTSDGRAVGYTYASTAGAKRLTGVTAVDGTATTYDYASTGGISAITDPLGHVSARNKYDAAGRITSQRDERGAKTTFGWDESTQTATITDPTGKVRTDVYVGLNLVQQIDGNGQVVEQLYDGDNNQAAVVDAAGKLFRNNYDERDRLVKRIAPAPLNYTEEWTYDEEDRVTSHTDADGYTTTYTYNAAGLVTSVDNPDGGSSAYTYTDGTGAAPANLLASTTDPLGRTTTFTYDAAGDMVSTTSPGGRTSTSTYDNAHRVTSTTSPSGAVSSYSYDVAGRLLTATDPAGATTTNTYDAAGGLIQTTDALGRPTKFNYDAADRLIRTRDAEHFITRTSYDRAGRVATTTDELGAVTTYEYDDAGRLTTTTDALGHTTTTAYDVLGQVTSVTDAGGGVTSYTYDAIGQVTSMTDPDGVTQTTTYDRRGHVAQVTDGMGGFQQTFYDSMGRPEATEDSDGVYGGYSYDLAGQLIEQTKPRATSNYVAGYYEDRTTYTYDADGLLTSTVEPRGNVPGADPSQFTSTATYDADGRAVTSTDPLGRTTTTEYDVAGRPVALTDPDGSVTSRAYNELGLLAWVRSPGSGVTRYVYDRVGNVRTRVDSKSRHTTYTYDGAGNVLTETDPLGRVTSMSYDVVGNVTDVVKPSGTATVEDATDGLVSFEYDELNRPVATTFSDATPGFTYDYTPAGRVDTAARVQGSGVIASSVFTYDGAGRVVAAVNTGGVDSDANYSYSSAGRLSGAAFSTGMSASYDYNAVGELTKVTSSGVGAVPVVVYAYDPSGRVKTVTRQGASPLVTSVGYDVAGQLEPLQHASGGTVLEGFDVTRDLVGNPTQVTTTKGATESTALYAYDPANRLKYECYPTAGNSCTGKSPRNTYTYDTVGNRTGVTSRTVVGTTATTVVTTSVFDAGDQLLTQSVDGAPAVTNTWTPNGELASSTTTAGTQSYDTDLSGELVSSTLVDGTVVGYTHDTAGNRTSRTVNGSLDVSWVWDTISALPTRVGQYDNTGALETAWLPDPTSATGSALAHTSSGVSDWLLSDPFANTVASVSTTGTALSGTRTTDAFGVNLNAPTGTMADSQLGFAGQYLDSVTGLYDMRARDYQPSTGAFTANDPVDVATGTPFFAGYSYAHSNSLMFTDANGLEARAWGDERISGIPENSSRTLRSLTTIKQLNRQQANAPSQLEAFLTPDGSTVKAGGLGLLNFGGGALNGAISLMNGATMTPQRYAVECATGMSFDIPSVGIAGDYNTQKYSSWSGSSTFFVASLIAPGAAAEAFVTRAPSAIVSQLGTGAAGPVAARFIVNSAGEATMYLRAGPSSLEVSEHAALRMTQRGISIEAAESALAHQPFSYFHQGTWKTGFYDPATQVFLGSVRGKLTTVIKGASSKYIDNLKVAKP
ncbi:RHS repeat-associated core domain-containing protein [Demequina aurantiaca]|uniref:RHS repeat-associated core domain-containing protein n=1 Tax=Demequina aurantiaca TaxID=676200 RepID=UPI001364D0EC|nr:RHS repeat-associated core domain-containing protein [Demequina aurantiaca]